MMILIRLVLVLVCAVPPLAQAAAAANATLDPGSPATSFGAPVDQGKILTLDRGNATVRIAADQIQVVLKPGRTGDDAQALARHLGGTVVGQVPRQRAFQLRVPTRDRAGLDALLARARAHPAVLRAGYNPLVQFQSCPAPSDNHARLHGEQRCAFETIEYYSALTLFEAAREHLSIFPVSVAVLDTGMSQASPEFRGLSLVNLDRPGRLTIDSDPQGHGTQVVSLIAAADDNFGINGIASRFLGPRLSILVGTVGSGFEVRTLIDRAVMAGADVVNMSFRMPDSTYDEVREMFESYPEVLFVTALPVFLDEAGLPYERLDPPGGLNLDNVVTVGGLLPCSLIPVRSYESTSPQYADIRAPSVDVPVLGYPDDQRVVLVSGTSFALPQVSSLAAILKSLSPDLSPGEIKGYLQQEILLSGPNLSYRLGMLRSLARLLLDMNLGPPVSDWNDPTGTGVPLPNGPLMGNVCGEVVVSVAGRGELASGRERTYGIIRPDHTGIYLNLEPDIHGEFHMAFPIQPGSYRLVEDNDVAPGGVEFGLSTYGRAQSGTLVIESCWITERFPDTNAPLVVNMSGRFDGVLEWHRTLTECEGYFTNIPFTMRPQMQGQPLLEYFEQECQCGIQE